MISVQSVVFMDFSVVLYCCVLYRGSNAGLKVFNSNNKEILIFLSESARGSTDFNNIFPV